MFRVIKRLSIYLFSMPVSSAQWRGEVGAFYNNTLTSSKISIFDLLLSLSYWSIFYRLDLIKLPLLIISLVLNGMFFHFEKCKNNNLKAGVYLFTTIYRNLSQFRNFIWWRKFGNWWIHLVREDHLSNSKRGGVCVYHKSSLTRSLPFRVINVKYL